MTSAHYPHKVVREQLSDAGIELTNFFFRYGANIYVLTYDQKGKKMHTFIDTGYASHRDRIFPILKKNGIDVKQIENIIITHRHPDHSGLAGLLARESGARVIVHENFKDFVEGNISEGEKRWLGDFDPSELKKCDIQYLSSVNGDGSIRIRGLDFPKMGKELTLGDQCRLEIFTCPESDITHSPDQLLILYSPGRVSGAGNRTEIAYRPLDQIIFSGDLWLMRGPIFERNLRSLGLSLKFVYYRFSSFLARRNPLRTIPREQDAKAKDALKQGFALIRVKPGHGDEFIGSNLIPKTLLADRDLLIKFGFSMDADKSVLQSESMAPKVADLRESAYTRFADILNSWMDMGYNINEISGLLARIYLEQSGGGPLVEEDRKERRKLIQSMLMRLKSDKDQTDDLHRIAKDALAEIKRLE